MNRSRHLIVMFCLSVIVGIAAGGANAQSTAAVAPSPSFHATTAQSQVGSTTTFTGTIQSVVSTKKAGSSQVVTLVLAGPQGITNANVGPYLNGEIQKSLAKGTSVQVSGIIRTYNGQNHLLVQELTVGNQKVRVRNENGSLIRPGVDPANRKGHSGSKGGN